MCIGYIAKHFYIILQKCLYFLHPPVHYFFSNCNQLQRFKCANFLFGCALVQAYYHYLWRRIPLPYNLGDIVALIVSLIVGLCNVMSIQLRCICLLILPMYCGTAGRGVLKVVVLTYVVAGPITNMGMNAREVVRVFACTTQLSYNLSINKHVAMVEPFRKTALSLHNELDQLKETLSSINDIMAPIEHEIENPTEILFKQKVNDYVDKLICRDCRSQLIDKKFRLPRPHSRSQRTQSEMKYYHNVYQKKMEYRCENQLSNAVATCLDAFDFAYEKCLTAIPYTASMTVCELLKLEKVCEIMHLIHNNSTCDRSKLTDAGFTEAYLALKRARDELTTKTKGTKLQYKLIYERDLYDIQDPKETGEYVMHVFEEKIALMGCVAIALNVYVALLFLRVVSAAISYHDNYLTSIEYDNIYITNYFKILNERRRESGAMTLLPLKKMERIKYIDIHCFVYKAAERSKFLTQILKVMLEMVTATTFVMLDRLFYEALDVVQQHANIDVAYQMPSDLNIEVKGTGILAAVFRKLLSNLTPHTTHYRITKECVPNPQAMPWYFYIKIYGGYLWILLLLYVNPYMMRLRRLICSYFYPRREKQRILHLFNDILKKRMKMDKTFRRKAVQTVRAHYLSGENLLSLRLKFPRALGWLRIFPAARMTCLICGETEPNLGSEQQWHSCFVPDCPFVFCVECWREAGARCLACDPSLIELSDMDSLSEDDHPKY